jgi:hypothetical protein
MPIKSLYPLFILIIQMPAPEIIESTRLGSGQRVKVRSICSTPRRHKPQVTSINVTLEKCRIL